MIPITSTAQYRNAIRFALGGSDPALIQDALYDVDEFLRSERSQSLGNITDQELVARALDGFGSPEEVADSYRETEIQVARALAPPTTVLKLGNDIFGVLVDPHAYGALFLMLLSLFTGIFYFTWAVAGVSMSLGFAILIIGIPFFVGFAASLRMLGLMEGRLLEGLIGVRMPRRPASAPVSEGWIARASYWVTDRRTWSTLLYLIVSLPLGILSFTIAIVLFAFAVAFFATPFVQLFFDYPIFTIASYHWYVPWWVFPVFWLIAIFFDLLMLHVAKLFGKMRAGMAKALLVT